MAKPRPKNADLVVQAKDTYDPADYITVHKTFFEGMQKAIREAHSQRNNGRECICIYCTAGSATAPP